MKLRTAIQKLQDELNKTNKIRERIKKKRDESNEYEYLIHDSHFQYWEGRTTTLVEVLKLLEQTNNYENTLH